MPTNAHTALDLGSPLRPGILHTYISPAIILPLMVVSRYKIEQSKKSY
jgi:hypothetical protein